MDWIFPPLCGGCGKLGYRWCPDCDGKVTKIGMPYCSKCGVPTNGEKICQTCRRQSFEIEAIRAYGLYEEPLRNAIHQFKYRRDISMGDIFAEKLQDVYKRNRWEVDLVVPVPLSIVRLRERGYNQSALLAYPLALAINKSYCQKAIVRVRETESQVNLAVQDRKANVEGAFRANEDIVKDKRILLIDDVCTTGSTLNACATALKQAKAKAVYGITLARTRA